MSQHPAERGILSLVLIGAALLAFSGPTPAATPDCDAPILTEPDLRICRTLDRQGRIVMVLTNLDDAGNLLVPAVEGAPEVAPRPPTAPSDDRTDPDRHGTANPPDDPPEVRVVVRGGDGTRDTEDGEVEVTTDGKGGTTIVINVNQPPQAPPAPAPPTVVYLPVHVSRGVPAQYRYPDRQPFLGWGTGQTFPSMFSGLVLNASNGYGLPGSKPCKDGYDCLFGPKLPTRP